MKREIHITLDIDREKKIAVSSIEVTENGKEKNNFGLAEILTIAHTLMCYASEFTEESLKTILGKNDNSL